MALGTRVAWMRSILLCLALAGVAPLAQAADFPRAEATRLVRAGFDNIVSLYVEPVGVDRLAIDGLAGLSKIDRRLSVRRVGSSVRLFDGDVAVGAFFAPESDDVRGWSEVATEVFAIGREVSPKLRASSDEALYQAFFDNLLKQLDKFSRYAGSAAARDNRAARDGFGGIGVRISIEPRGVRILEVLPSTPARDAGMRDNDLVTRIDGRPVRGLDQRTVVDRLRGPIRSKVRLTVRRDDLTRPVSIDIRRELIVLPTVFYRREGSMAVIELTGFNQRTAKSFAEAMAKARQDLGNRLSGYVIDLRGNPGGLLDQAVMVSDLFVQRGRILSTHGRHPDSHQLFDARPSESKAPPAVVLINGASASAAEIVAAALQDSGQAVVVGSTSFGKGTVQTVIRLPNDGELTLTWARLHAPSGYSFHDLGVMPSICTAGDYRSVDAALNDTLRNQSRIRRLAGLRRAALRDRGANRQIRSYCAWRNRDTDLDMDMALRLLNEPRLYERARVLTLSGSATSKAANIGHDQKAFAPRN